MSRINSFFIFTIILFLISCDFADFRLKMSNSSAEIINVETVFYKDSISQGIPCTSTIIEPKSTKILPLLNRKWSQYFNTSDQDSYLEVTIMKMSVDEYNSDTQVQRFIDKKILNGEFIRYTLNLEELNKKEWVLNYPNN